MLLLEQIFHNMAQQTQIEGSGIIIINIMIIFTQNHKPTKQ
jgi:hypothetical protein